MATGARCECVSCSMCGGKGTYYVDHCGRMVTLCDDLCDLEMCEECGGSGISYECGYCMDERDREQDADREPI